MKTRGISKEFIEDLKDYNGELNWVYEKVKASESEFSLEIRDGYINIYYRGGSILKIEEIDQRSYKFFFDTKYGKKKGENHAEPVWCEFMDQHRDEVENLTNEKARKYFDKFKEMMDGWFDDHNKKEREYQHYASLRDNNDNVLDIEYAISGSRMRLDMVMINDDGELYLIENKYGNYALSSGSNQDNLKSGLAKHYGDMIKAVTNETYWENIKVSMKNILDAKIELGLIPSKYKNKIKLDATGKPVFHILFVLADLTLTSKSKIIENEKDNIREWYGDYIDEYPPEVLTVGKNEYKITLKKSNILLDYSIK